ncbi:MAG: hypothetical protein ABIO79_14215 [Ferruginibacter sp.]
MKRLDLVQLAFIIAGICSVFFILDLIPTFLYYLFLWLTDGLAGGYLMDELIITILLLAVYLLFTFYSIRNSKQLAGWITDKADLHGEINLKLGTKGLLFTFFIILAVYGLIRDLPWLLKDSYDYIMAFNRNAEEGFVPANKARGGLFIQFCSTGLFVVLLIYANVFADFFAARIKNQEPPDQIMEKTD